MMAALEGMEARLQAASRAGDLGAFLHLLQKDSLLLDGLNTTPYPSNNPLHIAALLGNADFAREILNQRPQLAEDRNEQGFSPLHVASANGHPSVVKELLKVGSHLCLIRDKDGFMPIHTAVIKGRIGIVQDLIDACPEAAKAATCQGETVVHLAVKSNRSEVVEFLVEKLGGDDELLNSKDEKGNTILHLAAARKQLQILKFLLSKLAIQVNSVNLKGFTPLDVLLESPNEQGDLVLGEMIRAAGGKKAEEESPQEARSHPIQRAINPAGRSPARSNWKGRLRHVFGRGHKARTSRRRDPQAERENGNTSGTLMVVATLIATVTFQAGTNPPEGFGQSDSKRNNTNRGLSEFLLFDIAGLFLSLSIILLLIGVVPRKKRISTNLLKWVTWIAVFCTAIAFALALRRQFPFSSNIEINIFLLYCCGVLLIMMLWSVIRFSFKAGCLKKRGSVMNEANTTPMGAGAGVKRIVFVGAFVFVCFIVVVLFAFFLN